MADSRAVTATKPVKGKLTLTINVPLCGIAGQHWKEQLTGANRKKWGRIYIDGNKERAKIRRRNATWADRGGFRNQGIDLDECPGAMFQWDGAEVDAHCLPVDFGSNRSLGSTIRHALEKVIEGSMEWYEVEFKFVG